MGPAKGALNTCVKRKGRAGPALPPIDSAALHQDHHTRNPKKHSAPAEKAGALLYIKEQLDAID